MEMLAGENYSNITEQNRNFPETEAQIEKDHADAYTKLHFPIADWGGTAVASQGGNILGIYATPEEKSNLIDSYFEHLAPNIVLQSDENIIGSFYHNFPGNVWHLNFDQIEHDALPYAWNIAESYSKNMADDIGSELWSFGRNVMNAIDSTLKGTDSSDGGSRADFFDLLDRLDKVFPHIGGGLKADDAPDWGAHAAFDPVRSNDLAITVADRYLKTGLKEATNSPARGESANIEADGLAEPRFGLPAGSITSAVLAGIDHGEIKRTEARQQSILPRPGRHVASGRRDDPIFIYEISTRVAH
jgi:hypothetical protein